MKLVTRYRTVEGWLCFYTEMHANIAMSVKISLDELFLVYKTL